MEEEEMGVYTSLLTKSEYDLFKFREVLKESKEYLLKLDSKKRLEIIRELLKNPNFNDTDVYYLAMIEIQEDPSYKPPCIEPKKPPLYKIRFVMSGRRPTKPIWEEKKAAKRNEKSGRKRLRSNSDCEFDEEEEKARAIKNRAIKKNMNEKENEVVLPENRRGLPAEFKERIQNLGGNKATLVIQKDLFATDVSTGHARLSIPWRQIKDKGFLSEQEKAFLAPRENGSSVGEIRARVIGENGKENETVLRRWKTNSPVYNLVKGWNGVVSDHGLCKNMIVQLWSFRVKGKLWFALVKLGMKQKKNLP